jgi:hypothetical protein
MTYRTNYCNNQQNTQELINEVVAHFDYLKVHQTMNHLNWTWYYSQTETKVPSIGEIVFLSQRLLYDTVVRLSKLQLSDMMMVSLHLTLSLCLRIGVLVMSKKTNNSKYDKE